MSTARQMVNDQRAASARVALRAPSGATVSQEGDRLVVRDPAGEVVLEVDSTRARLLRAPRHLRVEAGAIEALARVVRAEAETVRVHAGRVSVSDRLTLDSRALRIRGVARVAVHAARARLVAGVATVAAVRSSIEATRVALVAESLQRTVGELRVSARTLREIADVARETLGEWRAAADEADIDAGRVLWRSDETTAVEAERVVLGSEES